MITHTLIGKDGEVHVFWHNYPDPIYLYLGGYGISVPVNQTPKTIQSGLSVMISGGNYYSVINAINAPSGGFKSMHLIPRAGWSSTHLFGGNGAYPYWESNKPVPPNQPLIFYVNGTKGRTPAVKTVFAYRKNKSLRIHFENTWYTVGLPF